MWQPGYIWNAWKNFLIHRINSKCDGDDIKYTLYEETYVVNHEQRGERISGMKENEW